MPFMHRTRLINPRLGTYYGIYASLLLAVLLLALMFEQLGTADAILRGLMFTAPVLLYGTFGIAGTSHDPLDFYAAGRRIPSFFSGLVLAITALGGIGVVALTGTVFLIGTDGFSLLLGWISGLVFMAVLLVPFLRKFGAYTLPSYLGARLESPLLRITAAAILAVPVLLLVVAEIRIGAFLASQLLNQSEALMVVVVTALAVAFVAGGGMRSLTWATAAKAIAVMLALAIPITIVSLLIANLPLPQLTHGNLLRTVARLEISRGAPTVIASAMLFEMPGAGLEPLAKRFLQSFGQIGNWAFSLTTVVIMTGVAGSPALLGRAGTTSSVYQARKSMGWAVLIMGLVLMTLAASAAFLRGFVVEQVVGSAGGQLPIWFQNLQQLGLASVESKSATVTLAGVSFRRDAALFALPMAAGLPASLTYLTLAGGLAAALAAISAGLACLGGILAEDVLAAPRGAVSDQTRIMTGRIGIGIAAAVAAAVSWLPADPLQLAMWGLAISASASFPVLVLSVLWKRLNVWGAMAAITGGFGTCVLLILMNEIGLPSLQGPLPAVLAMPVAFALAALVTRMTPPVSRHALELVRDMRVPGGETLFDRQTRLARLQSLPGNH
jgi:cation/acetate symporter